MRVKTRKTLVLTKAEQRVIQDLYKILNEDSSINVNGVWNILLDISMNDNDMAQKYGYDIEIIN